MIKHEKTSIEQLEGFFIMSSQKRVGKLYVKVFVYRLWYASVYDEITLDFLQQLYSKVNAVFLFQSKSCLAEVIYSF